MAARLDVEVRASGSETYCGIELAYHQNLRIVQLNLNEVPQLDPLWGTSHPTRWPNCWEAMRRQSNACIEVAPQGIAAGEPEFGPDRVRLSPMNWPRKIVSPLFPLQPRLEGRMIGQPNG